MPRKPDPVNEVEQARVARWRSENALRGASGTRGRPEASAVDVALAAAATAYVDAARDESSGYKRAAVAIVAAAVDLLVEKGFDRREAAAKLKDRLRRRDLWEVAGTARVQDRLTALSGRTPKA
ncbi:MAG: hypothetical protein KF723_03595 [Rhizobiaceae bacterium]|nr:hypothetical protein [Rhizobiaceae bacterium]